MTTSRRATQAELRAGWAGTGGRAACDSRAPLPPKQEGCRERLAAAHRSELLANPLEELAVIAAISVRLVQPGHVPVVGAGDGGGREVSVQDDLGLVDCDELPNSRAVLEQREQVRETGGD